MVRSFFLAALLIGQLGAPSIALSMSIAASTSIRSSQVTAAPFAQGCKDLVVGVAWRIRDCRHARNCVSSVRYAKAKARETGETVFKLHLLGCTSHYSDDVDCLGYWQRGSVWSICIVSIFRVNLCYPRNVAMPEPVGLGDPSVCLGTTASRRLLLLWRFVRHAR